MSSGDIFSGSGQDRRNQPGTGRNSLQNSTTALHHANLPASNICFHYYVPMTYAIPMTYAVYDQFPTTHGLLANRTSLHGHQIIIPSFDGVVPTSYMPGNHEAPQVQEYVPVPYNASLQHTPNRTQISSHRRSTQGHSDFRGRPQIPAQPSVFAPRGGSLPVSTAARLNSRIQRREPTPGNNSSRFSSNAPSNPGSGIVKIFPKDTNDPTSAIEQPREAEPVNDTNPTQNRDFHGRISVVDEVVILDLLHHDGTEGCGNTEKRDHEQFDGGAIPVDDSKDRHGFRALNCGHRFLSKCIRKWFCFKRTCPICRAVAK